MALPFQGEYGEVVMTDDTSPVAHTRAGDLTLDQIGEMQPGMARLMLEISQRHWILYYAAKAENWDLARHELGEIRKTTQIAATVRPKYRESMDEFDNEYLQPLLEAIRARDWPAFAGAHQRATDRANEFHGSFGYGYIEWQLPDAPPPFLRFTAQQPGN